jgi:hypothetical protein
MKYAFSISAALLLLGSASSRRRRLNRLANSSIRRSPRKAGSMHCVD